MVFPVSDHECKLLGLSATWLNPDATDKRKLEPQRQFFGPSKGGFIQLGKWPDPNKPLIIAEGIETALSAMQLTGFNGIAALSANNMPHVIVPPCVALIICADNDEAGRKAAEQLAENQPIERRVRIALVDGPDGYDFNDALRDAQGDQVKLEELKHSILAAKRFKRSRAVVPVPVEKFLQMQFPSRQFLIEPWLETSSSVMVHGYRGEGKTWFGLSVAVALASRSPIAGLERHAPAGAVL
jgi:putative DNA primase/helicase